MKTLNFFLIFFFLFSINAYSLPKCEGGDPLKWNNCVGSLSFPGGKYIGEWSNGAYNGKGVYTVTSGENIGDIYKGEFKNNLRHGEGTYTFSDGTKVQGQWKNGVPIENN
jgi:hypothetical protein